MNWIPISDQMPDTKQRVYVCVLSDNERRFQTMAEFIPKKSVLIEDYCNSDYHTEDGDYDEAIDDYYMPEGWYEWQLETDTHWLISGQVTHWMPLFKLP